MVHTLLNPTHRADAPANRTGGASEPNGRSHQRTEQPAGNRATPSRPCVLRLCAFVVRSSSLVGCFVLRARLVLGAREFRAPGSRLCAFVLCFPPRSLSLPPPCSCRPCACARSSSASLLVPRLSLLRARLARAGSRAPRTARGGRRTRPRPSGRTRRGRGGLSA